MDMELDPTKPSKNKINHKKIDLTKPSQDTIKNKEFLIKDIILEQLQEYSKTGNRKYNSTDATIKAGYKPGSRKSFSEQVNQQLIDIVSPIRKSASKAKVIYDMIFGQVQTSYHNIKKRCDDSNMKLLTSSTQWFSNVKNRSKQLPISQLNVKTKCKERGHIDFKQITRIGQKNRGCDECSLNYLNKPLQYNDVVKLAESRNLRLKTKKDKLLKRISDAKKKSINIHNKNGRVDKALLKWSCLECNRKFYKSYGNIRDGSSCPDVQKFAPVLSTGTH